MVKCRGIPTVTGIKHGATAARGISVLCLLILQVWLVPIQAQDTLTPDQPLSGTLSESSQTYTLTLTPETPFIIEVSGYDVYAYLVSDGQPLTPLNTETRDQDGMPVTRIAFAAAPTDVQMIVEGAGAYTLRLKENAVVGSTIAVLQAGDRIVDDLFPGETHRYLLEADEDALLTLTVGTKQRSFYARVVNSTGETITPLLSLADGDGFRDLIALRGSGPYSLYLSGIDRYTVSWEEGDTLSASSGTLTLGTTTDAPAGGGRYIIDTDEDVISIFFDEFDIQTTLFDRNGAPVAYTNRFYDQEARRRVFVYPLIGQSPYTLLVQSVNTYSVMPQRGDASQVDLGTLAVNSTASATTAAGRTPVYTLEAVGNDGLILTLFYDPETLRTTPPFTLTSSDGQITTPSRIWGGTGQIQAFFTPQGQSPYHLALALSGKFSLSLVARQAAGVSVALTTVDTNLRSGPTLNAPVLRKGQPGETYTAIGRSADDTWVLLLTDDDTALWVYRQLVSTAPGAVLANLPLVQAASVGPESSASTQEAPVTSDATDTPLPAPTTTRMPQQAPVITFTPVPSVCQVISQGGVNVRRTPSTTGEVAGSLNDGQTAEVIGQIQDDNETVWWQLANDTWVRSDVVSEHGDCTLAPHVVMPR
jgi:uncharacterized protein YgiM (DUF1202 family)